MIARKLNRVSAQRPGELPLIPAAGLTPRYESGAIQWGALSSGAIGQTGATGPVGATGATGPGGATGATGPGGAIGAIGANGPAGSAGSTGATGVAGSAGSLGATGPVGAPGATGASGAVGATGPVGATGAAGFSPPGAGGPVGGFSWELQTGPATTADRFVPVKLGAALTTETGFHFVGQATALTTMCNTAANSFVTASYTVTLRVNGADTAITQTIVAPGTGTTSATFSPVPVSVGDLLSMKYTQSTSEARSSLDLYTQVF